jgi:putative ABC transport system permease protein
VIVLVAVGTGTQAAAEKQLAGLGTNTLTVQSAGGFGGALGGGGARGGGGAGGTSRTGTQSRRVTLTSKDTDALSDKTNAPSVAAVVPVVNTSTTGTYNGATHQPSQFIGTTPEYKDVRNAPTASGSFFTQQDVDDRARVVLLGTTVVTKLFGEGVDPIASRVKFGSSTWTVIGVLKPKGTNGVQDQDDIVIAPVTAVQDSLTGAAAGYTSIVVQAKSASVANQAQAEITSTLNALHKVTTGQSPFNVLNQASLLETRNAQNRLFTVLLGAVAAISLLVGGIGVMNIMLVTVTERTREIGIRKAIGAQRSHILSQFLVESVMVTVFGGLLGVVAGLIGSRFQIVGVQPVIAPYSVFLAFGVAVAIGLFFGIYPANRAASLRPIDALRYE